MLRIQNVYGIMTLVLLIGLCVSPALGQRRGKSDVCPPESGGTCDEGRICKAHCPHGWILSRKKASPTWNKSCACEKERRSKIGSCYKKNKKPNREDTNPIECERDDIYGTEWTSEMIKDQIKICKEELASEENLNALLEGCYTRATRAAKTCHTNCLSNGKDVAACQQECTKVKIQGNADCKREDEARRDEIAERCRRIWATDYSEAGFCREYNYRGMEQTDEFYKRPDSSAICSSADTSSGHEETDMDDFLVFE